MVKHIACLIVKHDPPVSLTFRLWKPAVPSGGETAPSAATCWLPAKVLV